MICDLCKKPIRQDYPGFYRVDVTGINFKFPFKGEYYFHQPCWDWVWEQFVENKSKEEKKNGKEEESV